MSRPDPMWGHRVRGLVLGLALGDSLRRSRGHVPANGELPAGVSTQLAAFTIEGAIRAMQRANHKGVCRPPTVVWHAYTRWAAGQGIEPEKLRRQWEDGAGGQWPDGWLARVPQLRQRRGSAPATVSADVGLMPGSVESPVNQSAGAHALTRLLPAAALAQMWDRDTLWQEMEAWAALTHGHVEVHAEACTGVLWAAGCLGGATVQDGILNTGQLQMGTYIGYGMEQANSQPRAQERLADVLRRVGSTSTATAALAGAVYVTHGFPDLADAAAAVQFAAAAPGGAQVATVTGAVLGAAHGVDVWPIELVSQLELAWVMDTLARDLVLQLTDNPGGGEFEPARDPGWWDRYPGW